MKTFLLLLTGAFIPVFCSADTQQVTRADAETGARTWEMHAHGVQFSMTQILPEQLDAFFVNRGFTLAQIATYSASCVYMTVLRNDTAPGSIHFISNNWPVRVNGKAHPLLSVDAWVQTLKANHASPSALVAFRWAQFPPEHEYEPGGDWNQGMLSIGLPPGSEFDVMARWDVAGKIYESQLRGVQCAKPADH